ncbi:hypothetical protein LPJ59_000676 [Coemansia sp. RSA 2399]|nr:hypothetical protein LPJ59_000676 [Coemansia sp. RSA 2399]KAJ1907561.1 hypothetical protein LPJ81_000678 [Coemansia sp. IMI 209127]
MSSAGIYAAYAAIGSMALAPIYFGSFFTLDRLKSSDRKKRSRSGEFPEYSDSEDEDGDENETVTTEDAYMFPVYGSVALFSMYMIFKYLNKDWVNLLLSGYFALLGVVVMTQISVRIAKSLTGIKMALFHVALVHRSKSLFEMRFTYLHVAMVVLSSTVTGLYLWSKNWVLSNAFGLALSLSAINMIRLDSFKSGMIMLAGLFVYDIFWVFGTEVMVSVAKNFEAPIKVVAPKSLWPDDGKLQFTMLGLGDIIVPGVFVALCLRFDRQRYLGSIGYAKDKRLPAVLKGQRRGFAFPMPYFSACLAAYVAGLTTTIVVMHVFKAAQPALLYLSPACILSVVGMALVRGELGAVLAYNEESDKKNDKDSDDESGEIDKSPVHRYNLRHQAATATPASAGELADDEQENVSAERVLDDKVSSLLSDEDKTAPAETRSKSSNKVKQRKTKTKKS